MATDATSYTRLSKDETETVSRREFLTLAWKSLLALSGVLGLGGLLRFLSYQTDPAPPTRFDLGTPDQYLLDSRTPISQAQAVLLNTPAGFQALSLICPHLGCTVNLDDAGFTCPCHGSQFDPDGSLRKGPATKPLSGLRLEVDTKGHLILHTD